MKPGMQYFALCAAAVAVACTDASQSTAPAVLSSRDAASATRTPGGEKFVSIGTSISMGWASNGVYFASQQAAWPALLNFGAPRPMSLPLIESPGCQSPLVTPLGGNLRLSGESFAGSSVCAPNVPGVELPTRNVAVAGSIAAYALQATPELAGSAAPWFARVLPPGMTQVTAALAQNPTLVSIELGGQDVLLTTGGLVAPGVTFTPFSYFVAAYDAVLDAVGSIDPKAVLFGMPVDGTNLPSLRRADEIWADRAEFAALHVDVSPDCETSPNYINVSIKSLVLVFTAAYTSTHALPNPVFSCADIPGTEDQVLTPADLTMLNGLMAQMSEHIAQEAAERGYALTSIGALYDRPDIKPPTYSVVWQLTSATPYGPFVSADAVHPSPLGQSVLAFAAARALNKTYPGIAAHTPAPPLDEQLVVPRMPTLDLEWAKHIARENQGVRLPTCLMPGGCVMGSTGRIR